MQSKLSNHIVQGFLLAIIATLLWSGNFIIARKVSNVISPISLAFYRWACASLVLFPFAYKKVYSELNHLKANWKILSLIALTGIALFNTFVYVAGHNTTAINMALIGTTSSPIFATIMAVVFLKERLSFYRIIGMILCILGIVLLISKGSWEVLLSFKFSSGDAWILAGAFAFAVYNILVRRKPIQISALSFLLIIFVLGTLMLFPFFIIEQSIVKKSIDWSNSLIGSILYLGIGTSVLAFWCWNLAISKLGAGRTVLFGNLIPIFSTLEAVLILGEAITPIHFYSGILVIGGLVIANFTFTNK
ncbi:DMT family transporter [Sediminibacterium sp.]|uniref:DMT family transporter n=1 Tax=Sediminibacterium sp. TaxID=1917865 RepID=UPI0027334D14|nr:DMT family transporter [Sediminibacterium sp.]MDP3394082.1 DMT family transporter [Sediminibacterium sp.]MDP3566329.1 DMT family transporter [Sediminibacterium sp.]